LNDCSETVGGTTYYYDAEIADAVTRDRKEFFNEYAVDEESEKFDVVVLDMNNFRIKNTPTESYYTDDELIDNILNSISGNASWPNVLEAHHPFIPTVLPSEQIPSVKIS